MAREGDNLIIKELKDIWTALNVLREQDLLTLKAMQLLADNVKVIASRVADIEKSIAVVKN